MYVFCPENKALLFSNENWEYVLGRANSLKTLGLFGGEILIFCLNLDFIMLAIIILGCAHMYVMYVYVFVIFKHLLREDLELICSH